MKNPNTYHTTETITDGQPCRTEAGWIRLVCCHCALVHDVHVSKAADGKGFILRLWQRARSTAAYRRSMTDEQIRKAIRRAT